MLISGAVQPYPKKPFTTKDTKSTKVGILIIRTLRVRSLW